MNNADAPPAPPADLRRRRLLRNMLWNLAGVLLPLAAAALAAPLLLAQLGSARFGLLALAWTLIGYFSIFDLGLGRAVTQSVSERMGRDIETGAADSVWTAALTALVMSLLGALLLWLQAETLIGLMSDLTPALHDEAVHALRMLALALPAVVLSPIFSGALEAYHRFDLVNLLRLPAGLVNFLAPLAVLPFSQDLAYLVIVLGLCKLLVTAGYLFACRSVMPGFMDGSWQLTELRRLLVFGGWITLGNILNPIVAYTDRFLIGAYVSVTLVGYYVLPYEVLLRILVPTIAITAVLFPAFSSGLVREPDEVRRLFSLSLRSVLLFAYPLTLMIAGLSHELLGLWLDAAAADAAHLVTKLFAVGIFLTCLNQVALTLVQAGGRPDLVPKLFLLELPVYLPLLVWAVKTYGITGAAAAWLARIGVDFCFVFFGTRRWVPLVHATGRSLLPWFVMLLTSFMLTFLPRPAGQRLFLLLLCLAVFALLAWSRLFDQSERTQLMRMIRRS